MRRLLLLWVAVVLLLASCGGGVGSGGTGIEAGSAMSYSAGSVRGLGSITVNGIRYETDSATVELRDASELKLGMTVEVLGSVSPTEPEGTASHVVSAAELRGVVESVDAGSIRFTVLGIGVQGDAATALEGIGGVGELRPGDAVQVYGLPGEGSELRATRVERLGAAGENIASGAVSQLDTKGRSFRIGNLRVDYAGAKVAMPLAPGQVVRVRGTPDASPGVLNARTVEPWSLLLPAAQEVLVELSGLVSAFEGLDDFELAGVRVRAEQAQITAGSAAAIGSGVSVTVTGRMVDGVLVASRVALQHVAGTGGPVAFSLMGPVAAYQSPSSFMVQGQRVNAGSAEVVFVGGTAAALHNGLQVKVLGDRVIEDVLIATEVVFEPLAGPGHQPPPAGGSDPGNGNSGQGNGNSGQGNGNSGQGNGNSGQGNGNSGQGNGNSGQGNNGNSGQGNGNSPP
jgi:hypothetical protein